MELRSQPRLLRRSAGLRQATASALARAGRIAGAMGHAGLARRWREGQRLIHDNGITYNVYSDPQSTSRPWPLDPVPLVMDPAEWKTIEAAIIQRATLFNSILADLYGPQRLLREKMLPAELVFPNPAFLRPCWGIEPPGGVVPAHVRGGSGALARRAMVGAGGSHASAFGRRLRARKSAGDHARAAGRVPRVARPPPGQFLPDLSRRAAAPGARPIARIRASCCSRPAPTTKPISNTRSWRAISATRWSKAATSPCATIACS